MLMVNTFLQTHGHHIAQRDVKVWINIPTQEKTKQKKQDHREMIGR